MLVTFIGEIIGVFLFFSSSRSHLYTTRNWFDRFLATHEARSWREIWKTTNHIFIFWHKTMPDLSYNWFFFIAFSKKSFNSLKFRKNPTHWSARTATVVRIVFVTQDLNLTPSAYNCTRQCSRISPQMKQYYSPNDCIFSSKSANF